MFATLYTHPFIANVGADTATSFLDTPAGKILGGLFSILGLALILVAIFKASASVLNGKVGAAAKIGISVVAFVAILFNPLLLIDLIAWFGELFASLLSSLRDTTDGLS